MMKSLGDVDETFADLRLTRCGHQERGARLFRTMGWSLVAVMFVDNNVTSAVSSWSCQRKAGPQLRSGTKIKRTGGIFYKVSDIRYMSRIMHCRCHYKISVLLTSM